MVQDSPLEPNHEAWNQAIFEWFFGPHVEGRPVLLSVDDAALTAIAESKNWAVEDAAESLRRSVRVFLDQSEPFTPWVKTAERWEKQEASAPPPFLHILALTVLPVTERRDGGGLGGYYKPLFETLGIADSPKRREDYRWNVPVLWRKLGQWLDSKSGRYGLPTARPGSHATEYLGYSRSQAVVRSADRSAFIDFFEQAGYQPGEEVSSEVLFARFERWMTPSTVSERLRNALRDSDSREMVAETLRHDLSTWNGESRDEEFRSVLRVIPRLNAARRTLTAVLIVPNDFEGIRDGEKEFAGAGSGRVFLDSPISLIPESRRENFELLGRRLQLRHSRIHAFEEDPILGGYSAVDRITAGRTVWFAVAKEARETIGFLEGLGHAAQVWPNLSGWFIFRDVRPNWDFGEALPEELRLVAPPLGLRAELRGGLSLGKGRYCPGGAPDLYMAECPIALDVYLNESKLLETVPGQTLEIRLAEEAVDDGTYQVSIGDQTLRFAIDSSCNENDENRMIVNVLAPNPPTLLETCVLKEAGVASSEIVWCGAQVRPFPPARESEFSWPPAVDGWVVFGESGQSLVLPSDPAWLVQLGERSCHMTDDDLLKRVNFPALWFARVMPARVHIRRLASVNTTEIVAGKTAYFGDRALMIDRANLEDWMQFSSLYLDEAEPCHPIPLRTRNSDSGEQHHHTNSYQQMLEWCSDRVTGKIRDFVETFEWVEGGSLERKFAYRALGVLNRLSHLEVDWNRQTWSITPTTIVVPSNSGGVGFVVGRQQKSLREELEKLIFEEDLDVVLVEAHNQINAPRSLLVRSGSREALSAFGHLTDIPVISNASGIMAAALPEIDRMIKKGIVPAGFERRKIDIEQGRLTTTAVWDDSWNGSYEHDTFGPKIYSIWTEEDFAVDTYVGLKQERYIVDKNTAIWFALRNRRVFALRYDSSELVLSVPLSYGLPLLHERALIMASGRTPTITRIGNDVSFKYVNISVELFQRLKETLYV